MRVCSALSFLVLALVCGCAPEHLTPAHGDAGQFILQHVLALGNRPVTANALPSVSNRWRYSEDKDGVLLRLPREQFPAVETFLRQAFGEPYLSPTATSSGGQLGVYKLSPKGGAIQFGYTSNYTQIIVIRPLNTMEVLQGVTRALGKTD